nr:hypothetical protein [Pseudomonas savastanoi]
MFESSGRVGWALRALSAVRLISLRLRPDSTDDRPAH